MQARRQEDAVPKVEARFYTGKWFATATVLAIHHSDDSITIGTCVLPRPEELRDGKTHGGAARLKIRQKFLSTGDRWELIRVLRVAHNARVLFSRASVQPDGTVGAFGRVTNVFPPIRNCPNANWLSELSGFTGLEFGLDAMIKFTSYKELPLGVFQDTLGCVNQLDMERGEIREFLHPEEVDQLEEILDHVASASGMEFANGSYTPSFVDMAVQEEHSEHMVRGEDLGGYTPSFAESMGKEEPQEFEAVPDSEPAAAGKPGEVLETEPDEANTYAVVV